jgi:diadenosine tetraphosphatase ApaH/serine/threonine PP2A family protein phosphatase
MKIAILSDIHSNLEALDAALEYIRGRDIDNIYCLGDIVGYGPNPNECVERIRENCKVALMGNHDYAAVGMADIEYFNDYARASVFWTRDTLSQENLTYLESLPFSYEEEAFLLVHSSPSNPSRWHYILSREIAEIEMDYFKQPLCFIGHSHVPVVYSADQAIREHHISLDTDGRKYIINVGSIGQPRDGEPKLCFVVYDTESRELEYVRLHYPVNTTYEKIIKNGLPVFLAERLLKGY